MSSFRRAFWQVSSIPDSVNVSFPLFNSSAFVLAIGIR
jgi:hypothetical protein